MDGLYGRCGEEEKYMQDFGGESRRKVYFNDLGLDGRIILKCIVNIMAGRGLDTSVQDRAS